MFRERCLVTENKKVAPGHFVIGFASPRIARSARPGQFVQIQCSDGLEPLLPRPFSFLDADKKTFSILYHVVGQGTEILSRKKKGESLWVTGPLGNGFWFPEDGRRKTEDGKTVLVGGGVGIPPLLHLATALRTRIKPSNVHVFLGARNKALLLCEKDFKKLGVGLHVATDDGSKGRKGFITELLEEFLISSSVLRPPPSVIFTCGPTPMLAAVSSIAQKYEVPCEVSVEVPMACGFGACIGCAVKVKTTDHRQQTEDRGQDADPSSVLRPPSSDFRYAIACMEGPVFEGRNILW